MPAKTVLASEVVEVEKPRGQESASTEDVIRFKKRMLEWPNPVEYVNNMYGCHPDGIDNEYFKVVFAKNESR